MPFNLRGGRPKNMGQGIYWVQRARDQSRRRASAFERIEAFNARYNRITRQLVSFMKNYGGPSGTVEVVAGSRLDQALDRYNDLKGHIDRNIDAATNGDLSKLATAAKVILVQIAKREGWQADWDVKNKRLVLKGSVYDFS